MVTTFEVEIATASIKSESTSLEEELVVKMLRCAIMHEEMLVIWRLHR